MTGNGKRYKGLRTARRVVAAAVAVAIAMLWVGYGSLAGKALGWISHTQIVLTGLATAGFTVMLWLVMTSLFGRIYCSMFCPLGVVQDVAARIGRGCRRGSRRDYRYAPPLTPLRYGVLAVVAVCLLAGLMAVPALVDPHGIYTGFAAKVVKPVWGWVLNGVAAIGEATGWWSTERVAVVAVSAFGAALSVATMGGVAVAAWLSGRLFCNTLCPVGTVMGVVSARSLWHIDIDTDLCTNCRRCEWVCKAQCINLNDHVVDGSRCVMCFDCLAACPDDAIFYRPDRKQLSLPMMQSVNKPALSSPGASAMTRADAVDLSGGASTTSENIVNDETIP